MSRRRRSRKKIWCAWLCSFVAVAAAALLSARSDFESEPESKPVEVARGEPLAEQDRRLDVGEALGRSWQDWLTSPVACTVTSDDLDYTVAVVRKAGADDPAEGESESSAFRAVLKGRTSGGFEHPLGYKLSYSVKPQHMSMESTPGDDAGGRTAIVDLMLELSYSSVAQNKSTVDLGDAELTITRRGRGQSE
ncbi:MAG: hypothetical protein V5A84_03025 [Planctomycetota bacterium]